MGGIGTCFGSTEGAGLACFAAFGLAAALARAVPVPAFLALAAEPGFLAAVPVRREVVRDVAERDGAARVPVRDRDGAVARAPERDADDRFFAAVVSALAAAFMALVAVAMERMAVDIVRADAVALVAAEVTLVAADDTLVAADDTPRVAAAVVPRADEFREEELRAAAELRADELRAAVPDLELVFLFAEFFAALPELREFREFRAGLPAEFRAELRVEFRAVERAAVLRLAPVVVRALVVVDFVRLPLAELRRVPVAPVAVFVGTDLSPRSDQLRRDLFHTGDDLHHVCPRRAVSSPPDATPSWSRGTRSAVPCRGRPSSRPAPGAARA
jgi:hypothetical protein